MDTLRSASHLQREIGDELFGALVSLDNTERVREFAKTLVATLTVVDRTAIESILEVNYDLAFEAMVAAGHYDRSGADITAEHFPNKATGVKRYEPVLVHLGRDASTKKALAEIERQGLIPASAAEILAYGAKCPEKQRKYSIVALGQFWRDLGFSFFPCLWGGILERYLSISRYRGRWGRRYRFLALREVP